MLGKLATLVRLLAFVVAFVAVLLVLLLLSPVTVLNKPLRRRGWRLHELPGSVAFCWGARFLLWFGGVSRHVVADKSSLEACNSGSVIFLYNHTSNLDPIIVQATCLNAPKFVYKKSLGYFPLFGWVLQLYHHIGIDRSNREKAIHSLDTAVAKMRHKGQSIAVAPEGTRSKTGALQPFKKGPFHMAVQSKTKAPTERCLIVPVLIAGAYELCPPGAKMFAAGGVDVVIRPPIEVGEGETADALLKRVEAEFAREVPALHASWGKKRRTASVWQRWRGPFLALAAVVGLARPDKLA